MGVSYYGQTRQISNSLPELKRISIFVKTFNGIEKKNTIPNIKRLSAEKIDPVLVLN